MKFFLAQYENEGRKVVVFAEDLKEAADLACAHFVSNRFPTIVPIDMIRKPITYQWEYVVPSDLRRD